MGSFLTVHGGFRDVGGVRFQGRDFRFRVKGLGLKPEALNPPVLNSKSLLERHVSGKPNDTPKRQKSLKP